MYEPKVEDGDEKTNVVEDSLDAMVKEMKELLLDHRKPSTPVQPRTPVSDKTRYMNCAMEISLTHIYFRQLGTTVSYTLQAFGK